MGLSDRKLIELKQKVTSLNSEFRYWREKSETGELLDKHYTQIRAITVTLEGFQQALQEELNQVAGDDSIVLNRCRELEYNVLELHRIWDFFRRKLLLRTIGRFQEFLYAADEFAWACYQPVMQTVAPEHVSQVDIGEPPLVFFNGGSSPFVASRHQRYYEEPIHFFPSERLITQPYIDLLAELPVPVIGVPWFQIHHLPDTLVIAHEVGHNIENDFQLARRVDRLIQQTLEDQDTGDTRRRAWTEWRSEVFADFYGTLTAGPAFCGALIDFLADDPVVVKQENRQGGRWGAYPISALRVQFVCEVLKCMGFSEKSGQLWENQWVPVYGKTHSMSGFVRDLPHIASALLSGSFPELGGRKLIETIRFTSDNQQGAENNANLLLKGYAASDLEVRTLFAGSWLAFKSDPTKYVEKNINDRILKIVPSKPGRRSGKKAIERQLDYLDQKDNYRSQNGAVLYHKYKKYRQREAPIA